MPQDTDSRAPLGFGYQPTPPDTSDRAHLTEVIREGTGCSAAAAKATFDDLLGTITASLKEHGKVQLYGFGTFTIAERGPRDARNPRTGEAIRVEASRSVRFKPGKALKDSV